MTAVMLVVRMIIDLSIKQYSVHELAAKYDRSTKTIRRIISAIELSIPIIVDYRYGVRDGRNDYPLKMYKISDRHWAKKFAPVEVLEFWEKLGKSDDKKMR